MVPTIIHLNVSMCMCAVHERSGINIVHGLHKIEHVQCTGMQRDEDRIRMYLTQIICMI